MLFDNRKSLKQEFRNQLKEILKKEGFLEGVLIDFDHYLNDIVNDKIKILRNFFFRKSESFLSASKKLKETITKLDNKVILIIDNLERIHKSDDKEWKEILGFIHELKEIGLKIVMLINTEEMKEKDSIEYFDKFFEQKLLLNDVEIEEIVGEIETDTNKKDFIEYMRTLEKNLKEEISSIELKGNNIQNEERKRDELNLKKLNVLIITLKELLNNSRKLEKMIKEIDLKRDEIKNIYNFTDEERYEELLIKSVMFSWIYLVNEREVKPRINSSYLNLNKSIGYLFKNIRSEERVINRLLYFDSKEKIIINQIEEIQSKENIEDIRDFILKLYDYSEFYDKDFDKKKTKEVYKILEEKIKGESTESLKNILKDVEVEFLKLNNLVYPITMGVLGNLDYKFEEDSIVKSFSELNYWLNIGVGNSGRGSEWIMSLDKIFNLILNYYCIENYKRETLLRNNLKQNLDYVKNRIKDKDKILKNRENKGIYSNKKIEDLYYQKINSFLEILYLNNDKIKNKKLENIILIEVWSSYDLNKKLNYINEHKNKLLDINRVDMDKKEDYLEKIRSFSEQSLELENEENLLLELNSLIVLVNIRLEQLRQESR